MNLKHLLGFWNGTTPTNSFLHYTELDIFTKSGTENDDLYLRFRSSEYAEFPEVLIEWIDAETFQCPLPHTLISSGFYLHGRYNTSNQILHVTFSGSIFDIQNYTVELEHDAPSCQKYRRAAQTEDYNYRVPTVQKDEKYYQPDDASKHGLDTHHLTNMVKRLIRLDQGIKNDPRVDSILILKDDRLVLEECFWGVTPHDHHEISSCTKSVTSLLFGIAWDQGYIDLDEPVADVFRDIESDWTQGEPIRVRHLLSMTSGTENPGGVNSIMEQLLRSSDMAKIIMASKRIAAPGSRYDYDNQLPFLAGLLLERKLGRNLEGFAKQYLFDPLDIKDPQWAYMENQKAIDGQRFIFTCGAMTLPLRDFAKLGQLVLHHGFYAGKQIVSKKWLDISTAQHTVKGQWPYGFYWHLSTEDERHFQHFDGIMAIGQGEQICAVIPELDMVIAWMSSTWINEKGYRVGLKVIDEELISKIKT